MIPEERESTNRFLHVEIVKACWHECIEPDVYRCKYCGHVFMSFENTDYCSSLDLVSRVEAKVIEKAGRLNYLRFLADAVAGRFAVDPSEWMETAVTATAEERAQACVKSIKGYTGR